VDSVEWMAASSLCRTRRRRAADAAARRGANNISNALAALAAASVWVWALQKRGKCFLVCSRQGCADRLFRYDAGFSVINDCLQLESRGVFGDDELLAHTAASGRRISPRAKML